MTTILCKAKNPATCPYHHSNTDVIYSRWVKALEISNKAAVAVASNHDPVKDTYLTRAYLDAKANRDEAEETMYATPGGLKKLQNLIDNEDNPIEKNNLLQQKQIAEIRISMIEDQNIIDDAAGGALIPITDLTYAPTGFTHGGNVLWPETTGSKYDDSLSTRQIATKVSADLRFAQKQGVLPKHLKFKVSPNSRSRSVNVCIIGASEEQIYESKAEDTWNGYTVLKHDAQELLNRTSNILDSYQHSQYDEVEGRTNLTNYWSRISYEDKYQKEKRLQKKTSS